MQTDIDRYAEYPKLRDLVAAKDAQVRMFATPPYFMKVRYQCQLLVENVLQPVICCVCSSHIRSKSPWQRLAHHTQPATSANAALSVAGRPEDVEARR